MIAPPCHLPENSFEWVPVSELIGKFHPKNPNSHPKKQLKAYEATLKENGIRVAAIISNLSGRLVKGHGAILTAHRCGWTHYPVIRQDFETEENELSFLSGDNLLSLLSKPVESGMSAILERMQAASEKGLTPAGAGFTGPLIKRLQSRLSGDGEKKPEGGSDGAVEAKKPEAVALEIATPAVFRAGRRGGMALAEWDKWKADPGKAETLKKFEAAIAAALDILRHG